MKIKATLFCLVFLLISSGFILAQNVNELIKQGDELIDNFNNQEALERYLQADKISPNNWEVNWRISRAYVNIANQMPANTGDQEDDQLAVYEKALDYADKAISIAPDKSATYLRRAIANGKIALFKGVFSVAGVVNKVREDIVKAIQLGNGGDYVQSLCHYVLGRTHAKVSEKWKPARAILGLGWGDIEIAIEEYKKAIKLNSDFRMFYLDLARAYIEEDEYKLARQNLKIVPTKPKLEEDDDKRIEEAKKLLVEIEDED